MSKFLKTVLSAEEKAGEFISEHKLLKTAIVIENVAGKLKNIILQKAVIGIAVLSGKHKQ